MPVIAIDLTFNSGVSTQVDDKGYVTASARREYNVFVSDPNENELTVRLVPSLPREKSEHPLFPFLYCDAIEVQREGPRKFVYTANYKSRPYKDATNPQSPLNEPVQISYFTISNEGGCEEDINGKPIVTRCGEPVVGITRVYSDLGIRLTKNFGTFDPPSFYLFINTVNSDTFLGFPAGTLWIANISAEEQFFEVEDVTLPYWKVTVEINARKPYRTTTDKAWYVRYRHQGFRSFQTVGSFVLPLKVIRGGEPVTTPVLLDANGFEIPESSSTEPNAVWLESQIYETRPFASMGF